MEKLEHTVLTLKNDLIFKAVYGNDTEESKFVLIALLNHILDRKEDPIISLEYKNPFQLRSWADEKESILDIKVRTDRGELIDIEMQMCSQAYLKERLVYYHGGLIRSSLKKGDVYGNMLKTITICIVDDILFSESAQFLSNFRFFEETNHYCLTEATGICIIELPKVNPTGRSIDELNSLELCLEYIRCADERGSDYVDALIKKGGKELAMAQHILEQTAADEFLREKALAREKFLRDVASNTKYLQEKYKAGHKAGLNEGIAQGRHAEKLETAKALKADGISLEKIKAYTGLTDPEIRQL